jgi:replication factor C small subunit
MLKEITDKILTEKYRPNSFDNIVLEHKNLIKKAIKNSGEIPSFIFHSNKPGTGKTSCAKIIIKHLDCDYLLLNSSDERGIDTIRDKISLFSRTLALHSQTKKCIFLDESDALTKPAQDCLRNLMETYSSNCFFIFSCNDLSKIIEPIRSRCMVINFDNPNREDIYNKIQEICIAEQIKYQGDKLKKLADYYYPDIRSMILALQKAQIENKEVEIEENKFLEVWEIIKKKDISALYNVVYSGELDLLRFNGWLFQHIFKHYSLICAKLGDAKVAKIGLLLAEIEKSYVIGVNLPIVFLANMTELSLLL